MVVRRRGGVGRASGAGDAGSVGDPGAGPADPGRSRAVQGRSRPIQGGPGGSRSGPGGSRRTCARHGRARRTCRVPPARKAPASSPSSQTWERASGRSARAAGRSGTCRHPDGALQLLPSAGTEPPPPPTIHNRRHCYLSTVVCPATPCAVAAPPAAGGGGEPADAGRGGGSGGGAGGGGGGDGGSPVPALPGAGVRHGRRAGRGAAPGPRDVRDRQRGAHVPGARRPLHRRRSREVAACAAHTPDWLWGPPSQIYSCAKLSLVFVGPQVALGRVASCSCWSMLCFRRLLAVSVVGFGLRGLVCPGM